MNPKQSHFTIRKPLQDLKEMLNQGLSTDKAATTQIYNRAIHFFARNLQFYDITDQILDFSKMDHFVLKALNSIEDKCIDIETLTSLRLKYAKVFGAVSQRIAKDSLSLDRKGEEMCSQELWRFPRAKAEFRELMSRIVRN